MGCTENKNFHSDWRNMGQILILVRANIRNEKHQKL
jgi:hypothetical protein